MKKPVVTIIDLLDNTECDAELPQDCEIRKIQPVIRKMLSALHAENPTGFPSLRLSEDYDLYSKRLHCILKRDETLQEAGVYGGDILVISPSTDGPVRKSEVEEWERYTRN